MTLMNAQDRFIEVRTYHFDQFENSYTVSNSWSFVNDVKGKNITVIDSIFNYNEPGFVGEKIKKEYDNNNQLITEIIFATQLGVRELLPFKKRDFEYDANGKLNKILEYRDSSGSYKKNIEKTYEYGSDGNMVEYNCKKLEKDRYILIEKNSYTHKDGNLTKISKYRLNNDKELVKSMNTSFFYNDRNLEIKRVDKPIPQNSRNGYERITRYNNSGLATYIEHRYLQQNEKTSTKVWEVSYYKNGDVLSWQESSSRMGEFEGSKIVSKYDFSENDTLPDFGNTIDPEIVLESTQYPKKRARLIEKQVLKFNKETKTFDIEVSKLIYIYN